MSMLQELMQVLGMDVPEPVALEQFRKDTEDGSFKVYLNLNHYLVAYDNQVYLFPRKPMEAPDKDVVMNNFVLLVCPELLSLVDGTPNQEEAMKKMKNLSTPEHANMVRKLQESTGGFSLWIEMPAENLESAKESVIKALTEVPDDATKH